MMDHNIRRYVAVASLIAIAAVCAMLWCRADAPRSGSLVQRVNSAELIILRPVFSRIDLVCGTMPSPKDSTVILCVEAAFTGELSTTFAHSNIAGDHVCAGTLHQGYACERNTGAFVFYDNRFEFVYQDYDQHIRTAALHGGCAFTQEIMIHQGALVETTRPDSNYNVFRALCERRGQLCIIESRRSIAFGDFKAALLRADVTEALYLDMGPGWDYAWYRPTPSNTIELHSQSHSYCTNWLTFYR